jgi:hypothetical protein
LVSVIGIENARDFRDRVLEQREVYLHSGATEGGPAPRQSATGAASGTQAALLSEIRDTLVRIEQNLAMQKPS